MLSLIFLPVRLALALVTAVLWLPFVLVRLVLKLVGAIVILPIVIMLAVIGLIVGGLAFLAPLAVLGLFFWILVRLLARPAGAAF
jgi:hypothetical protein